MDCNVVVTVVKKLFSIYKRETHLTLGSRTIAHTHSHIKSQIKMAENKAIVEAQSKLRCEFLKVIRSRREREGITINFTR